MREFMANNTQLELGKIELRFGKINIGIDRCELAEIAKDSVIIVDHGRALKENGLISPTDYLKIIDRINENIDIANRKCKCKKDKSVSNRGE